MARDDELERLDNELIRLVAENKRLKERLSSYDASARDIEGAVSDYLSSNRLPVIPAVNPAFCNLSNMVQGLMNEHYAVLPRIGRADVVYWLDRARAASDFGDASDFLKEAYRATIVPRYRIFTSVDYFARGSVLVELACLHARKSNSTKVCVYLEEAGRYLAGSFEGKRVLRSGFMRTIKSVDGNVAMALAQEFGLSGVWREDCFASSGDLARFRNEASCLKESVGPDWILKF